MNEQEKNPAAVALGKLARGRSKRITEQEREARRQRAAYARECRAKKKAASVVFPP